MALDFSKKLQKMKAHLDGLKSKFALRSWNLAKRLDPKQMAKDRKKKGSSRWGNK